MKQIMIATKNEGKIREFRNLFATYNIDVLSLLDLDSTFLDIEETGTTFLENAQLKAKQTSDQLHMPVLADDSGLVIDALNGRPGIYSARYAGEGAADQDNIDLVMKELDGIPLINRSARFVCVLALSLINGQTIYRKGYCEGKIALMQLGNHGFGYDPIFIPDGYEETMAELSPTIKSSISHRRDAINQLETWLNKNIHLF